MPPLMVDYLDTYATEFAPHLTEFIDGLGETARTVPMK
jgi:hypothetical protein